MRLDYRLVLIACVSACAPMLPEAPPVVRAETAPPRRLEIATVLREGGFVEVSVADSGPGLAPEVARNLFQPFVTTKRKGMGLGLSICRTIVEAHGGRISVAGREGGGTAFRFTLPSIAGREEGDDV